MSTLSNASSMVSFRGEDEVDFDKAVDELFKDLQTNFNAIHVAIRNLAMSDERADDFIEMSKYNFEIHDFIETTGEIFKELKATTKQIVGKCPKECKVDYDKMVEERKRAKAIQKQEEKMLAQLELNKTKITE